MPTWSTALLSSTAWLMLFLTSNHRSVQFLYFAACEGIVIHETVHMPTLKILQPFQELPKYSTRLDLTKTIPNFPKQNEKKVLWISKIPPEAEDTLSLFRGFLTGQNAGVALPVLCASCTFWKLKIAFILVLFPQKTNSVFFGRVNSIHLVADNKHCVPLKTNSIEPKLKQCSLHFLLQLRLYYTLRLGHCKVWKKKRNKQDTLVLIK